MKNLLKKEFHMRFINIHYYAIWFVPIIIATVGCASLLTNKKQPISIVDSMLRRDSVVVEPSKLAALLPTAKSGTVFLIKDGVYNNLKLSLTKGGRNQVVVRPQSDGGVVFTGESSIRIWGSKNLALNGFHFKEIQARDVIVLHNCQGVEVSDNYFERCGNNEFGSIIRMETRSSFNNIHNNTLDANRSMGIVITVTPTSHEQCINNFIHQNHFVRIPRVGDIYPGKNNGLEAIQLGQGIDDAEFKLYTRIYENHFEDIIGDRSEIISVKSSNNYIYSNTFVNNTSGITLRYGSNNEVYDNYLENTSQGIRVFGYGHKIKDNFIRGGDVGIQLPATHFRNNERPSSRSGYFQQENVDISGNIIESPRSAAFSIGNFRSTDGTRRLMPQNVSIEDNQIIIMSGDTAQEYQSEDDISSLNLRIDRNTRVSEFSERSDRGNVNRARERYGEAVNKRVGTTWKRNR